MTKKKRFTRMAAVLLGLLISSSGVAVAELSCEADYTAVVTALEGAQLGQGLERKLITKVDNAWRIYQSGIKNSVKIAEHELDVALRLLDSPATKQIPPQLREELGAVITALQSCITGGPPVDTATLVVHTYLPSDAAPDGHGEPGPAGVSIRVGGVELGVTGDDGSATVQVPAGTILVEARLYPSNQGQAELTLAPGEHAEVDLILDDGKELAEESMLVLDEAAEGVLANNFSAFTLRFLSDDSTTVALAEVDEVALLDRNGGPSVFLESKFALQADGSLAATDLNALRSLLLARSGEIQVRVHGSDALGRIHDNVVGFYLARYRVVGTLHAPPSYPALDPAGLFVTATILNTDLVFRRVTDAAGQFELPLLPAGNLEFSSETFQNDRYYYGQGIVVLNGNLALSINMLHTEDLINGVPGFSWSPLPGAPEGSGSGAAPEPGERTPDAPPFAGFPADFPTAATQASVFVVAGAQNVPITQSATLNVPRGTAKVILTYIVQTDEYPYYVLSQSIYNDAWSLAVRGGSGGQQLFSLSRQINSQLSVAPIWQSNGTTGQIEQELDVSALTASADTTLTLWASSMNVGDGILPTRVQATLGAEPAVRINSMTPDTVNPTRGDSSFYSIPRSGATNHFSRWFTLDVTKPDTSTVQRVEVKLLGPGELMTVLDEGIGQNVVEVNDHTLRVRVSMHANASTIGGQPPPAHDVKYRFKLVVDDNGTTLDDQKDSGTRHALWRMPDGFGRYSIRDTGGDDWASRAAYRWMDQNRALLTRINDVSGEHARDIGHRTHQYGTDIDMFHFYTFPGAVSGSDNYNRLAAAVRLAIRINDPDPVIRQQAAEARQRVTGWVEATRTGLDDLGALNTVSELRYALGDAGGGLVRGWAQALLETGQTTVSGTALDLGLGTWSNTKYLPRADHNDHVHVTLNRVAIGN